jgi:hypothetical protein
MGVVLLQGWRSGDASVENIGIEIRSVRPSYGAQFRSDADLRKVGGIAQRPEYSVEAEMGREVDYAFNAIFEAKMQATITELFAATMSFNTIYSRGAMGLGCAARRAKSQSTINSARCRADHFVTNPSARGERRPLNRDSLEMKCANCVGTIGTPVSPTTVVRSFHTSLTYTFPSVAKSSCGAIKIDRGHLRVRPLREVNVDSIHILLYF